MLPNQRRADGLSRGHSQWHGAKTHGFKNYERNIL